MVKEEPFLYHYGFSYSPLVFAQSYSIFSCCTLTLFLYHYGFSYSPLVIAQSYSIFSCCTLTLFLYHYGFSYSPLVIAQSYSIFSCCTLTLFLYHYGFSYSPLVIAQSLLATIPSFLVVILSITNQLVCNHAGKSLHIPYLWLVSSQRGSWPSPADKRYHPIQQGPNKHMAAAELTQLKLRPCYQL